MRRRFAAGQDSKRQVDDPPQSGSEPAQRSHGDKQERIGTLLPHLACLLAAVGFTYSGALAAPFILWLDDVENLVWRFGRQPQVNAETLKIAVTESCLGVWEPVASVVKLILCAACGSSEDPLPHLAVNAALHAANACLLFVWLCCIFRSVEGCRTCALAVSLLWAVHPLRAEAVAWISCQPYLLAGFFSLLSLLCSAHKLSLAAVLFAAIAMLCKVPAVCLVLPLLGQGMGMPSAAERRFAEVCCTLVCAAAAVIGHILTLDVKVPSLLEVPLPLWPERALKATYMVWWCCAAQVWPSHLAHRHWLPLAQEGRLGLTDFSFGGCYVLWVAVTLVSAVICWAHRGLAVALFSNKQHWPLPLEALLALTWFAYNMALFPMTKVILHHGHRGLLAASRYTYLPDLLVLSPCCMCLVAHFFRRTRWLQRPLRLALTLPVILLLSVEAMWAHTEVGVWRTSRDVYQHALHINPMESFSAFNLAHSVAIGYGHKENNSTEAISLYRDAMRVAEAAADPVHFIKSGANLGSALSDVVLSGALADDHLAEAESVLSRALEELPQLDGFEDYDMNFIARFNLANVLVQMRRREDALKLYVAAAYNTTSAKRWEAFRNAAAMSIRLRDFHAAAQWASAGLQLNEGCQACKEMLEHVEKVRQGKVKPRPGNQKQKPKRKPAR